MERLGKWIADNWLVTIALTIVLAVIANLLTDQIKRAYAATSPGRKARRIAALRRELATLRSYQRNDLFALRTMIMYLTLLVLTFFVFVICRLGIVGYAAPITGHDTPSAGLDLILFYLLGVGTPACCTTAMQLILRIATVDSPDGRIDKIERQLAKLGAPVQSTPAP